MPEILGVVFKEEEGVFSDLAASVISCRISNCPYSISYAGNHRRIFLLPQCIFNHFNIRLSLDVHWMGHLQAWGAENVEDFVCFLQCVCTFPVTRLFLTTDLPRLSLALTRKTASELSQGESLEGSGFSLSSDWQVDLKPLGSVEWIK